MLFLAIVGGLVLMSALLITALWEMFDSEEGIDD